MKTFKIPVEYKVWGLVEVEANSAEEALEYANKNVDTLSLPDEPEYIESSYVIVAENAEDLEEYN